MEGMTILSADFPMPNNVYAANCPCRDMLDLLASKWSALAIGALEDGPLRFGVVRTRLEGISPKVLPRRYANSKITGWSTARCTRPCRCMSSTR